MSMDAAILATAGAGLIAGAVSGLHCGAMCGGIASAHATLPRVIALVPMRPMRPMQPVQPVRPMQLDGALAKTVLPIAPITRNLAFNAGRVTSYTLAGAIAGGVGGASMIMQDGLVLRQILFATANLLMIALGLYISGWWRGIVVLERGGAFLWRRIQPAASAMLKAPVVSWRDSFALGTLWGWIPCGLVYAMLVSALASGSAGNGALVMLAFGIGTLPNLLLIGWAGNRFGALLQRPGFRLAAGLFIIAFGVAGLTRIPALSQLDAWGAMCDAVIARVRG